MSSRTNNKIYSDRQEKMIANYLGWKQVVGSGSRPFIPGDVNAYDWLGECKTHDTEKPTIIFMKQHWLKICEEATAKHRFPVLFKDNGTQRADNTWVMTVSNVFDPSIINIISGLKNTSVKGNSLTFNLADTSELYKKNSVSDKLNAFKFCWEGRELVVMPLSTFKDFIEDNF